MAGENHGGPGGGTGPDRPGTGAEPEQALLDLTNHRAITEGDFEAAVQVITETAAAILQVPRATIWLFEGGGARLRCVDRYDRATDTHESGTELDVTAYPRYLRALENNRAIAATDARTDERTSGLTESYHEPNDIYGVLDATLRDGGDVIGVVCLEQTGEPRAWTDTEQRVATELADIVHRALRNRRSREQRQELEFRRSLLKAQQESVPDGIAVVGPDGTFLSYNDRICSLFDVDPELFATETADVVLDHIRDQLADPDAAAAIIDRYDGAEGDGVEELRLADGRILEGYTTPVEADDGTRFGRLWMVRDITDRRERQQELELRGRAIDSAPIGITITDPDREDNPLISVNAEFEALTGYDESEVVGRNCRFLQGEHTAAEPVAEMRAAVDDERPVTVELRNYREDGTEFWNRVSIAPVRNEAGAVTHFVGFQQDVTERVEATRQLRVLHRVLRHNLANQLTLVRGTAEEIAAKTGGEPRALAETAIEEIDRLLKTTDTHRDVVKLLRDRPTPVSQDLGTVLERVRASLRDTTPEAAITFPSGSVPQVEAVPMLERGLLELLENAITFDSSENPVEVTIEADTDTVTVAVSDQGPGLPAEEAAILTGDQAVSPLGHGTGMGLWLVYWIVSLSNGSIRVEENDPTGTTVRVELPRTSETR